MIYAIRDVRGRKLDKNESKARQAQKPNSFPWRQLCYYCRIHSQLFYGIIPNAGHEYGTVCYNCLDDVVVQFISQGSVEGLNPTCALV